MMRYWRDRRPALLVAGIALVLGVGGAYIVSIVAAGPHDDRASSTTATPSPEPTESPAPTTESAGVEVYSNVVQSGGEVQGGRDAGGVAPRPGCYETTSARTWFLSDPYPQGTVVGESESSQVTSAQSASASDEGYLFDVNLHPGATVEFDYELDACRPFTVELFFDASGTVLTLTGPDGVRFDTESATPPPGADIEVDDGLILVTYTPTTPGTWTIGMELTAPSETSFWLGVKQTGASETTPVAVCEVTIDGDTAILNASESYDPDGDPVTIYWRVFSEETQLEDGSVVDLSDAPLGWHVVYCAVGEESEGFSWVGVEVWVGSDRPEIAPPATPVTFAPEPSDPASELACTVTVGPDGLDYQMPEYTAGGERLTEWWWDLPFGEVSAELSGHIDIPDGIGITHYALCQGTTADGIDHFSSIHITFD